MKKTVADYPELVAQWHPTLNGDLTSDMFSYGSNKKVWWKCSAADDHEWIATIKDRTRGYGCPCCAGRKIVKSNCLTTTHPTIVSQWNFAKNSNLTPDMISAGSDRKVWWKCCVANDHEWMASIGCVVRGTGCPCCTGQKIVKSNCLTTTHPEIAAQWHLRKNGLLRTDDFTAGSNKKVWWVCRVNSIHEWESMIADRTRGYGCPICNESKGESAIVEILIKNHIRFKRECKFKSCRDKLPLRFDFVVQTNVGVKAIEYQGKQHYEPMRFGMSEEKAKNKLAGVQRRDEIKLNWCNRKGLPLLVIPYWEFDKISEMVKEFVL